jgi:hypothetical protein
VGRLDKFWSLAKREKKFLCEAGILLLLAHTCVITIEFRHIDKFLRTRGKDLRGGVDHELEISLVKQSISRAASVLPWKSRCLTRSIVEFIMLRRCGIPAILFAGVRFSGPLSLDAHAWVDSGIAGQDRNPENSGFAAVIRIGAP